MGILIYENWGIDILRFFILGLFICLGGSEFMCGMGIWDGEFWGVFGGVCGGSEKVSFRNI